MKKILYVLVFTVISAGIFAAEEAGPVIILKGHKAQVRSIAFTGDSKQIITAGRDYMIKKWPLKTGENNLTIVHGAPVEAMAYSPDGKYIASSAGDSSLKLWDAKDGRLISSYVNPSGLILSLAFSPDSDLLAAGATNKVNFWKTGDLKQPFEQNTSGNWAKTVVFSPDGKYFMSAGGKKISVWEIEYGNIISSLSGKGGFIFKNRRDFDFGCMVFDADFSSDSQYFTACGDDGTIKTWRVVDGVGVWKIAAHNGIALTLAFSKNLLATSGKDAMINFFDIKTGRSLYAIAGCSSGINELTFSQDGKYIAAACGDFTVSVWRLNKSPSLDFGNVRTAVLAAGALGICGIAIILFVIFRKKKTVKDWSL